MDNSFSKLDGKYTAPTVLGVSNLIRITQVATYRDLMAKAIMKRTILSSKPRDVTAWMDLGNIALI